MRRGRRRRSKSVWKMFLLNVWAQIVKLQFKLLVHTVSSKSPKKRTKETSGYCGKAAKLEG